MHKWGTGFDAQHEYRAAELRARQQRDEPDRSQRSTPEYPYSTPWSTPAAARRTLLQPNEYSTVPLDYPS
jgi:hypothetical protein